jgi:hypothetical protein
VVWLGQPLPASTGLSPHEYQPRERHERFLVLLKFAHGAEVNASRLVLAKADAITDFLKRHFRIGLEGVFAHLDDLPKSRFTPGVSFDSTCSARLVPGRRR